MFYVYILRSVNQPKQTYVGSTDDLRTRLKRPNSVQSVHTSKFKPWTIAAYIALPEEQLAEKFERYLKTGSGRTFARRHLLPLAGAAPPGAIHP
jgi:putative endonuclease